MCIAIAKPKGSPLPSRDILKICFKNNPDGSGYAFNRNGKNYVFKGFFTFGDFWRSIQKNKIKDEESAIIHFRVATHGGISKGTCHPFLICENFDWMRMSSCSYKGDVLIHNGQLNFNLEKKDISDSMNLAKIMHKYDRSVENNRFFIEMALINNDVKKMNRVAILNLNGDIELYGHKEPWKQIDGCFFSNESYLVTFSRTSTVTYYDGYKYNGTTTVVTPTKEQIQRFDYDEEDVATSKIKLCSNRKDGCTNLGDYKVYINETNFIHLCEKCFYDSSVEYCQSCKRFEIKENFTKRADVCDHCIDHKKEYFYLKKCEFCSCKAHLLVVVGANKKEYIEKYLCKECCSKIGVFFCAGCDKNFSVAFKHKNFHNLCHDCEEKLTTYNRDCTYCKAHGNLFKTSYSAICGTCLEAKKFGICSCCKKISLYLDTKVGDKYGICSTCRTKVTHILDCFENFQILPYEDRKFLIEEFNKTSAENKTKILDNYENNFSMEKAKSLLERAKVILGVSGLFPIVLRKTAR